MSNLLLKTLILTDKVEIVEGDLPLVLVLENSSVEVEEALVDGEAGSVTGRRNEDRSSRTGS